MVYRAGNKELAGANALITGSSRNIRKAIALTLADAGANVMINSRNSHKEAEDAANQGRDMGVRAAVCLADVSSSNQVKKLIGATSKTLGGIDILIRNTAMRG